VRFDSIPSTIEFYCTNLWQCMPRCMERAFLSTAYRNNQAMKLLSPNDRCRSSSSIDGLDFNLESVNASRLMRRRGCGVLSKNRSTFRETRIVDCFEMSSSPSTQPSECPLVSFAGTYARGAAGHPNPQSEGEAESRARWEGGAGPVRKCN